MSPAAERWLLWPLRWPRLVVLLATAAMALAAFGWPRVRFEPDLTRLLPADHPALQVTAQLDAADRAARTLWIWLRGAAAPARVPAVAERLAASPLVARVVQRREELFGAFATAARAPLWSLPAAARAELQELCRDPGLRAAAAERRLDLADDPIAAGELLRRDPLGVRFVFQAADPAAELGFAPDAELAVLGGGRGALLRLDGTADAADADYAARLMAHADAALAGEDAVVFGGYAVARADQARIRADLQRSSWLSMVLVAGYLCWAMRGLRLPLLVQLPASLSIAAAIPLGSALFGPLPTVAVAAVAVLLGLGVDFAIHYAARYRAARQTLDHAAAVRAVQIATVPELLIDMATTAATFVAVGSGALRGLAAFGWLLALGLLGSVLATVLLLPVLLRFAGHRTDPERSWLAGLADRWAGQRAARPLAVVLLLGGLGAGAAVAWAGVPLSADPERLRPADDPVAAAREALERELSFATVPVALSWPLAADPAPLWAALQQLRRDGVLRFWSGLGPAEVAAERQAVAECQAAARDLVPRASAAFAAAGLDPAPLQPALVALDQLLAAAPPASAPRQVQLDGQPHRLVTLWPRQRLDGDAFAPFAAALRERLGPSVALHGGAAVRAELEVLLRADLRQAVWLALLLAFLLVTAWLRSPRLGLLAILPSAAGLGALLGGLWLSGAPLTLVSFVAVPFVLGLGIDEGVHLVGHCRRGATGTGATGVGIVRTSTGTVLGFAALLAAASPGLRGLGLAVAAGSLACLGACLFGLAPLLLRRAAADR